LDIAEAAYNNSVHAATQVSPFFAEAGRHPNFVMTSEQPGETLNQAVATAHANEIRDLHHLMNDRLELNRRNMGRFYDQHRQPKEFEIGDMVWLKTDNIRTRRTCKKLDHRKIGPFQVTKRIGPLAYQLELPESLLIHNVFHVELLKKAIEPTVENQQHYDQGPLKADAQEDWEVEAITGSRLHHGSGFQYRISWVGDFRDTWEPI